VTARYRLLLADQALYAVSNLAAVALAGRVVDPDRFGRFMLAFLSVSVAVNGVRAFWSEPEMAGRRVSHGPSRQAAVVAAVASSMVAGAGIAGRVPWGAVVVAAAAAAVLQDRLRYLALLTQAAAGALRSDALWAAVMVAAGVMLTGPGARGGLTTDATTVLGLWTLGAAVAAVANLPSAAGRAARRPKAPPAAEVPPHPLDAGAGRGLFLADFAFQSGATQAAGLLLGLVMASGPYGELRAAITLLGPIGVANTALTTQLLVGRPAGARLVGGIGAAALAVVAALAAVPNWLGTATLGSAWPGRVVLGLIGATVAAQTVSTWGLTRLKVAARHRALLVLRGGGAAALAGATVATAAVSERAVPVAVAYLAVNGVLALAAAGLAHRSIPADTADAVAVAVAGQALAGTR